METAQSLAILAACDIQSYLHPAALGGLNERLEVILDPPAVRGELFQCLAETSNLSLAPRVVAEAHPTEDVHDRIRIDPKVNAANLPVESKVSCDSRMKVL